MAFDSDEKRSDFEAWVEEMSYEEEKELKRQQKAQKKAEKAEKKATKLSLKGKKKSVPEGFDDLLEEEKAREEAEAVKAAAESADKEEDKVKEVSDKEETTAVAEESKKDDSEKETEKTDKEDSDEKSSDDGDDDDDENDNEYDVDESDYEDYNPDYKRKKKKKKAQDDGEINLVKELLSLIIYIGIVIILCYGIITYVGQRTVVHGQSMETTLQNGDNLWIDKFSYIFGKPERFDIIIFPYQGGDKNDASYLGGNETETYFIKRVIGLPGETVQIMNGGIYINDELLNETYGKEVIMDSGIASEKITLGDDEYFVLGDNRNNSRDSRWADVGNIKEDDIVGKAVFRFSPFENFGKID